MEISKGFSATFKQKYGPWALVTGASSGIGAAFCQQLAALGLNVILIGRNKRKLYALSENIEEEHQVITEIFTTDLSSPIGVQKLIEEIKRVPVGLYVGSAGFGTSGLFHQSDLAQEMGMLQVNSMALMMLTRHFTNAFVEQKRGGIILMGSTVGFQGTPYSSHYAATKAYVQSLAEGLYHELKPSGVAVLAVAPGPVNSGFAEVANMQMGNTLQPKDVVLPALKALGKRHTVFPGTLTKILIAGLRTVPRWGKIRIMKLVMGGMTKHQNP
mgnify:CR=1 FL=1